MDNLGAKAIPWGTFSDKTKVQKIGKSRKNPDFLPLFDTRKSDLRWSQRVCPGIADLPQSDQILSPVAYSKKIWV